MHCTSRMGNIILGAVLLVIAGRVDAQASATPTTTLKRQFFSWRFLVRRVEDLADWLSQLGISGSTSLAKFRSDCCQPR